MSYMAMIAEYIDMLLHVNLVVWPFMSRKNARYT